MRMTSSPGFRAYLLSTAVDAIVEGSTVDAYWEALALYCERDGVDAVAGALARRSGPGGPSERWWRCNLLLGSELPPDVASEVTEELAGLEAAGQGIVFDVDQHALEVSAAIRYLEAHLARLRTGVATEVEHAAASSIAQAVRVVGARASCNEAQDQDREREKSRSASKALDVILG